MSRLSSVRMAAAKGPFHPTIHHTPDLPAIDYNSLGQQAPKLPATPANSLPKADIVVITWAGAEWAALQHVFCDGARPMPYSERNASSWPGWEKYEANFPSGGPSDWTYWGYTRLVGIGKKKVLLFKSNTHLDWPGSSYLEEIVQRLVASCKPELILSIGTAGGAVTSDHVGTVRAVSAGTLYAAGQSPNEWPDYSNSWKADWTLVSKSGFAGLLFPIPTTETDLKALVTQFNAHYSTSYSLAQLNPGDLNMGDAAPRLYNQTGGTESLLTTPTFVVATTAGNFRQFAVVEMDDAVIAKVCKAAGTAFGFIRNVSDPVQCAQLPSDVQGNWGGAIYNTYGLYTSYNGALAAWAVVAASST